MARVKAMFYLPLRDNDGADLTDEGDAVKLQVFALFGGWTFLGYVKGAFRMADGSESFDELAAYAVALEESRIGELERVLRDFKNNTTQEAIYLEIQRDVDVRFIR